MARRIEAMTKGDADATWVAAWLDPVANGTATMSRRAVASIETHGGLANAVASARLRALHLVRLTDDRGKVLVVASLHPFEALC